MSFDKAHLSTGLTGLDRVLQGLRPGDNVVWQVDTIDDYVPFVRPYCAWAIAKGKRLIYFRYAKHPPLIQENEHVEVHHLHPEEGFENFITQTYNVIENVGQGACYVFDALSELSIDQYSDRMLGNFYMVICPHLFALQTVAYYALLKNYHSFHAASPIAETTQILIDVYRCQGKLYVHPHKVKDRYSPSMHMLHVWEGNDFVPLTESNVISEVLTTAPWSGLDLASVRPGSWNRLFLQAEETLALFKRGDLPQARVDEMFKSSLRAAVTQEPNLLAICEKYLTLSEVIDIKKRMVSSGLIGGKSVGMLLARAILRKTAPRWNELLEPHDSFFVGSEVFYTFLVHNHCWRLRRKQKNPDTFLEGADEARQRILMGTFPEFMKDRFQSVLDYFGLSPIIVRSSSLLEDNFGNAFAGKYESVFCANQGPKHIRLEQLLAAVRTIYASSMSEEALTYRAERGVLDRDEQMALLIQRVSGVQYGSLFFPQAAGVGFSFNPYVWSRNIDPKAGMLRIVFGLGTRAVDRADDDYTRVVALNAPARRPEADFDKVRRYAQRRVDVLDLETNSLDSRDFVDVARRCRGLPLEVFASRDEEMARMAEERHLEDFFPWVPTFDGLLTETPFASDMREMLQILHEAYGCPVDIEFALNFMKDGRYRINLLQCRPLQIRGQGTVPPPVNAIARQDLVMEAHGAVIGPSRIMTLDRLIYIVPSAYSKLPDKDRYDLARIIGQITPQGRGLKQMLLGPGRWGTSTVALGVPVSFREIRAVSVLCEIVAMRDDLVPDVSLGTHFFSDLIETDILYVALFPDHRDNYLNNEYFERSQNMLERMLPGAGRWASVIRVFDAKEASRAGTLKLYADTINQKLMCYVEK
ncbi:MAG TPA: PEP/pyruvate-binding domain-containing protein [Planctomycetota bacterium]|jgi:hypothetical protein